MQRLSHNSSLIGRFIAIAVTTIVLGVSLVVGAAVFVALIGVAVIAITVFYVRLRWRLRQAGRTPPPQSGGGEVIEGEYVIEQESAKQR